VFVVVVKETKTMLFMIMHKNQPSAEAGIKPTLEAIENMGALMGKYMKEGRFHDGAGLHASKARMRLTFKNGNVTIKHGPYTGEHETPAAVLVLKVKTREEAIGWAERYGKLLGDGEIELGKVVEPWDLGKMPEPENPLLQFLLIEKEKDNARTSKQKADITRLKTEMVKAGVLKRGAMTPHRDEPYGGIALEPSTRAKRLFFKNNDLRTIDGPFTESKELIGGYAAIELDSFKDAIAMCRDFQKVLGGDLEIDIRVVDQDAD
jgi:hypothetical protein